MMITLGIWLLILAMLSVLYVGAVHWLLSMFLGGLSFLIVGLVGTALTESEECAMRRYLPMAGLGFIFVGVSLAIGSASMVFG